MAMEEIRRLNIGAGKRLLPGFINLDKHALEGIDIVADLEEPLPFEDNYFDLVVGSHSLEHVRNVFPLMQELHRIAKPGAHGIFVVPYGSSDGADAIGHEWKFFPDQFVGFGQPYHVHSDEGYRGDWSLMQLDLHTTDYFTATDQVEAIKQIKIYRNMVFSMRAVMIAVKPIRPNIPNLIYPYTMRLLPVTDIDTGGTEWTEYDG